MIRIIFIVIFLHYSIANEVIRTDFSCNGRTSGYYADIETGCQVYHMCDGLGRQFSYTCPNATLFQQRMLICDHWYMVNCSKAVDDYGANLLIGQKGKPFVEDATGSGRTPRPDLLSHPTPSEYNIIYRSGKSQQENMRNLVGAESDNLPDTDQPAYLLPSHWSTRFVPQTSTTSPIVKDKPKKTLKIKTTSAIPFKPQFKSTTQTPKSPEPTGVPINYKSYYKNTTPVFPKNVDSTTIEPQSLGIQPPNSGKLIQSLVKSGKINFESNFIATTPVYPKTVDFTSEEPAEAGVLPPSDDQITNKQSLDVPVLNLGFEPPKIGDNQQKNRGNDVVIGTPSKFYQPPKFLPDYTEDIIENDGVKSNSATKLDVKNWDDLKKKFLIPDYEFPLDPVSRPSYESLLSSFQERKK